MNMAGLLFNQVSPTAFPNHNSNEAQVDGKFESSFFKQLLSTEQIGEETILNDGLNHSNLVSIEDLLTSLNDMSLDKLKELHSVLVGDTEEIDKDEPVDNLVTLIHELLEGQNESGIPLLFPLNSESIVGQQSNYEQLTSYFINPTLNTSLDSIQLDQEEMTIQFNKVFSQVEILLTNLSDEQDMTEISPKILESLEKWAALMEKYGSGISRNTDLLASNLVEATSETREQSIWKELVSTFQKRNELASNQHYQTNAKVTSKDISKWLQNIFNAQVNVDENVSTQSTNLSNQPISKVEQYVIYMNQNVTTEPVDKQLIDQFQQVMRTSRFLTMNNGVNQLSISLRPDNLGEMMVRFTEINGEMTLKIIVSSQAARQMLESNVHQLKNMFAPHQVVIEEREVIIDTVQSQHEEQAFDEEEDHSHESNQEESRNFDEDFDQQFHEILMNEKV